MKNFRGDSKVVKGWLSPNCNSMINPLHNNMTQKKKIIEWNKYLKEKGVGTKWDPPNIWCTLYHHEMWKTFEIDWKGMIIAWNSVLYFCLPALSPSLSLSIFFFLIASNCSLFWRDDNCTLECWIWNYENVGSLGLALNFLFLFFHNV